MTAVTENGVQFPTPSVAHNQPPITPVPVTWCPLVASEGSRHACDTRAYTWAKHIRIHEVKKKRERPNCVSGPPFKKKTWMCTFSVKTTFGVNLDEKENQTA